MNAVDILIIIALILVSLNAIRSMRKRKSGCCGGNCSCCSGSCGKKQ